MSQSKPKPSSYADMIDLPDDPVEAPAPVPAVDPAPAVQPVQEVGTVSADSEPRPRRKPVETKAPIATPKPRTASAVPSRRELARLRRLQPKPDPADYAQRSLYAREETFERFRQLAFTNKTAAQALYREGLFLVLQKYGQADGLTVDDM